MQVNLCQKNAWSDRLQQYGHYRFQMRFDPHALQVAIMSKTNITFEWFYTKLCSIQIWT